MSFPPLRAYQAAIKDKENINIPFFKGNSMQIYLNKRGLPYMSVGGFGAVFRYKDKINNQYAIKVFTRDAPGRAERYEALHDTLQITKFPFMVDFQYISDGIKVGNQYYPVVVMEWGKGIPINSAIEQDLEDDGIVQGAGQFAGNLFSIVKVFQEWNMGHGDFQEGNLLVRNDNNIVLIDYDGMYIPALAGQEANEIGLADYQHPDRQREHFGSKIDDFALLSILYQLTIVTTDTWKEHHDDKRLMMKQSDYKDPKKSPFIKMGLKSKEPHVKELAEIFVEACSLNPLEINAIEKIKSSNAIMNWLVLPPKTAPEQNYSSIINKVVSLTSEEVSEFESNKIQIESQEEEIKDEVKHRSEDEGSWGLISSLGNLLFEEVDDNDSESTFSKMKKSFVNLLFDEVKEKEEEQEEAITPTPTVTQPVQQQPVQPQPDQKTITASQSVAPPPVIQEQKKETPPKDTKTAPLPDWMKNRKKRKF